MLRGRLRIGTGEVARTGLHLRALKRVGSNFSERWRQSSLGIGTPPVGQCQGSLACNGSWLGLILSFGSNPGAKEPQSLKCFAGQGCRGHYGRQLPPAGGSAAAAPDKNRHESIDTIPTTHGETRGLQRTVSPLGRWPATNTKADTAGATQSADRAGANWSGLHQVPCVVRGLGQWTASPTHVTVFVESKTLADPGRGRRGKLRQGKAGACSARRDAAQKKTTPLPTSKQANRRCFHQRQGLESKCTGRSRYQPGSLIQDWRCRCPSCWCRRT